MNRIRISALCVGKQLAGNAFKTVSIFPSLRISSSKNLTYGGITCIAKYMSTWNKPTYTFYSQDSRHTYKPIVELVADKKTKKYRLIEKPLQLSAEEIKALFYKKMEEPIALISQDKYYSYHKSLPNSQQYDKIPDPIIIESETIVQVSEPMSKFPKAKIAEKIPVESETFLNVQNAYEFPKEEVAKDASKMFKNSRKVIDSILEKELGENTMKYQESTKEEQAAKKSWNTIKYAFFVIGTSIIGVIVGFIMYIGAPRIDGEEVVVDMYSDMPIVLQYIYRTLDEFHHFNKLIKDPSRERLLPDVLKPPYYQPPYTLVLEFTDILVHPEWTYSTGWRFKKRPGLDQFLEALYARYEVVVYTAEMGMTVFPIIEALDKNNLISYKLVRDATKFMDGHHVKDLDKLNRELSKVIVVDWNPESTKLHEDNLFRMPRWKGNDDDTALYDLTALLIAISEWKVEDVRSVLKYYSEFEDPLASFKERQKLLAAQKL